MSSVVIVAKQCYLLAEAINYIVVNEVDDADDREWRPKTASERKKMRGYRYSNRVNREYMKERKPYNIVINFIPKGQPNTSSHGGLSKAGHDTTTVNIRVHGYDLVLEVFEEIVAQIRDQIPDEQYLNKMVEKFFADREEK
jgi:hypothetical protein